MATTIEIDPALDAKVMSSRRRVRAVSRLPIIHHPTSPSPSATMDADPITQFFPSPESDEDNILYTALGIEPTATLAEINVSSPTLPASGLPRSARPLTCVSLCT